MKQQKKIVVIGDSHSRGLASELKNYLGHEYSITGTIIPGAHLSNITQLAKNELTNLTRKDTIIVWGGSNDVYKN
jgi:predicted phosphodiesterase